MPPDEFANLDERHRCAREKLEQHAHLRLQKDTLDSSQRVGLYQAILACSRTSNLTVVDKILNLPREVRNLIYAALLIPGTPPTKDPSWLLVRSWEYFHGPWLTQKELDGRIIPHFFHHRFVGRQFASEVLDQFQITIGRDWKGWRVVFAYTLMGAFVDRDFLGVGKSMDELVRNKDIALMWDFNPRAVPDNDRYSPTYISPTGIPSSDIETALSLLADIPFNDCIKPTCRRPRRIEFVVLEWVRSRDEDMDPEDDEANENHLEEFEQDVTRLKERISPLCRLCHLLSGKGFDFEVVYVDHYEDWPELTFDNNCLTWTQDDWFMEFDAYWEENLSDGSGVRGEREVVAERIWDQFMLAFLETKPSRKNETSE